MIAVLAGVLGSIFVLPTQPARAADACGGIVFEGGRIRLGRVMPAAGVTGPEEQACLDAVARAITERSWLRSVTIAARVPDDVRAQGDPLLKAQTVLKHFVAKGVSKRLLSAVAPRGRAEEKGALHLLYTERRVRQIAARIGSVDAEARKGNVSCGPISGDTSPCLAGRSLLVGERIVVAEGSAVRVDMADGSSVRLIGEAELHLNAVRVNQKGERVEVRLELLRGRSEVVADSQKNGAPFEIQTRAAIAGVRGTEFSLGVSADTQVAEISTLEGLMALEADKGAVDVPAGFRSNIAPGEAPAAPAPLLPAPQVVDPRFGEVDDDVELRWGDVYGAASYRVVLAKDPDFTTGRILLDSPSASAELPEGVSEGKWFWRVAAVDSDGYAGYPSKIYGIRVEE